MTSSPSKLHGVSVPFSFIEQAVKREKRERRNKSFATRVEFVGSLLCSKRFFSGYSGFPLSPRRTTDRGPCSVLAWKMYVLRKADFSSSFQSDRTDVVLTSSTKTKALDASKRDQKQG